MQKSFTLFTLVAGLCVADGPTPPTNSPPQPPSRYQTSYHHLEVEYQYTEKSETNWITDVELIETNSIWKTKFNDPQFFGVRTVSTSNVSFKVYQCSTNLYTGQWQTVGVFTEGNTADYLFQTKLTTVVETNQVYVFYTPTSFTNIFPTHSSGGLE